MNSNTKIQIGSTKNQFVKTRIGTYYKTKLENCKGNPKKTWRIINECLNRPDKKGCCCSEYIF